jgi:glycosyltransferase involved in cell wall biosynthesis
LLTWHFLLFNEEKNFKAGVLKPSFDFLKKVKYSWELIFVDDGSSYSAQHVLLSSRKKAQVQLWMKQNKLLFFHLDHNQGKGKALAEGVSIARGKYILFCDVDCSVPIGVMPDFLRSLVTNDIAIASRRLDSSHIVVHQSWTRESAGRVYTWLSNVICQTSVADATCGFKGYKRMVAKKLFSARKIDRWAFDSEILFLARKIGYRIDEIPVSWMHKEGSRVKPQSALYSFIDLMLVRFFYASGKYHL